MMYGPFMFMGPGFLFVIIIVALCVFGGIVRARNRSQENSAPNEFFEEFELSLERLEQRVENIETIVLEKEKRSRFSSL